MWALACIYNNIALYDMYTVPYSFYHSSYEFLQAVQVMEELDPDDEAEDLLALLDSAWESQMVRD